MNIIKKVLIPCLIVSVTLFLSIFFRLIPVNSLWKGYSVLYVPAATDNKIVTSCLEKSGCKDFISLYNQKLPFISPFLSVTSGKNNSYLLSRNNYFFDKDKSFVIYYIPENQKVHLEKAVSILLDNYQISSGVDSKSQFPWIIPLVSLILSLFFLYFSKFKIVYTLSIFMPLVFAFCFPFYSNSASVCLVLYGFFLVQKVWRRKGNVLYILQNPYILAFVVCPVFFTFTQSILGGFIFILSLASSFCLLDLFEMYEVKKDSKLLFCPVNIRSAKHMNIINLNNIKKSLYSAFALIFLVVINVCFSNVVSFTKTKGIFLPIPNAYHSKAEDLPILDDYITWSWNEITFPYKKLNSVYNAIPEENEVVTVPRYEKTANGIAEINQSVYCYNSDFKKSIIDDIDNLQYPAIEKLIKKQGSSFLPGFSESSSGKNSKDNIFILLIELCIPIGMTIFYLIKQKKDIYV